MKMKKLLALVLSAVMAVSMLAACGGGGGGKTVSVDMSELKAMFTEAGYNANLTSSGTAKNSAKVLANMVEDMSFAALSSSTQAISNALSNTVSAGQDGTYIIVKKADAKTPENAAAAAAEMLYLYYSANVGVGVAEATTADGVECYVAVAVSF